jgi:hypothetical protein
MHLGEEHSATLLDRGQVLIPLVRETIFFWHDGNPSACVTNS